MEAFLGAGSAIVECARTPGLVKAQIQMRVVGEGC